MSEQGLLLAFYNSSDAAAAALRELEQLRFRRVATIHRRRDLTLRIDSSYDRRRVAWPASAALIGMAGGLLAMRLVPSASPSLAVVIGLVLALACGGAGWLLVRRYHIDFAGTDLDRSAHWLVPNETVLVAQASAARLAEAADVLRRGGEVLPSIFAITSRRAYTPGDGPVDATALAGAKIEEHARRLAADHEVRASTRHDVPLLRRLERSERVIELIRRGLSESTRIEQVNSPSAEWLLDNAFILQQHLIDVRENLPKRFYHELPVLIEAGGATRGTGVHDGMPRAYVLAEELVQRSQGQVGRGLVTAFLEAYQSIAPLTIGELWAMPLMIRMALIERVRRLAEQVDLLFREREAAEFWANRLVVAARRDPIRPFGILAALSQAHAQPSRRFAAHLTMLLYDEDAALVPTQSWLERALSSPLSDVILQEQTSQARLQVSIGDAITSLRHLSLLPWRNVFEDLSLVERTLREDPAGTYRSMDFETRDRYRGAVEDIARGSGTLETVVALEAVTLAAAHETGVATSPRGRHVGTYLIGDGRADLMARVGCREPLRRRVEQWVYRHHTAVYLSAIGLATASIALVVARIAAAVGLSPLSQMALAVAALLPASQLTGHLVDYVVTRLLPPRTLPKMSFEDAGIPDSFRTLVIVPMLLIDEQTVREEIDKLEIRYVANADANLIYGLFGDYTDAESQRTDEDEALFRQAVDGIERLNGRYGAGRFLLLIRERVWSASEACFIAWERKRGKLEELNALISGEPIHGGEAIVRVGDPSALTSVRFVITLDSDTQLPRDSARRMVETLAHPLNRPRYGAPGGHADGSYTIIQPRVSTSLPSANATPFSRLFTDPEGVDLYTRAVSNVYQDLAGEASYIGKGIYDPRAFHRALGGRFRAGTLLSHDLIEGAHVRVGLASDIELFDDCPQDYATYTRRRHRWTRGDWQIAEWWTPWVPSPGGGWMANELSMLDRWKVFDNLRRSLVPVGSVAGLMLAWLISPHAGAIVGVLVAMLMFFYPTAQLVTDATSRGPLRITWRLLRQGLVRVGVEIALMPHLAGLSLDAIARVTYRRLVSRRRLLEWTTAQVAAWESASRADVFLLVMGLVSLFVGGVAAVLWRLQPASLAPAAPFLALWFVSPLIGRWLNTAPSHRLPRSRISDEDMRMVRRLARRTWRYYDDFVGPDTQWLPPDNYQVSHTRELAMRTSPTNIGMWLLSALGAVDFGYVTADDAVERIGHTMATLAELALHQGHLLNWYDIRDLSPLHPRYVSTVDSGNLLGCLWALDQGLAELTAGAPLGPQAIAGLADLLGVLREDLITAEQFERHGPAVDELERLLDPGSTTPIDVIGCLRRAVEPADELARSIGEAGFQRGEPAYWAAQIQARIASWLTVVETYLPWLEVIADAPRACIAALDSEAREALDLALESAPSYRALAAGAPWFIETLVATCTGELATVPMVTAWRDRLQDAMVRSERAARALVDSADHLMDGVRALSGGMSMHFLYDGERRLFSIGFNVEDQRLDGSYYDLLASEARLASFVAIARGDVPGEHWLSLGRPFGTANGRLVLLSWTGTMFEYLMPLILQRRYEHSLLENASETAVREQIDYGRRRGVPWGISESAYGDLDANKTYQYKAFGVPGLGLKRGLGEDLVVAPYASMLALAVDPAGAIRNLDRLAQLGTYGPYGHFDALDFNRRKKRSGGRGLLVRTYMAHHQGMGFLAIDNLVHDGAMRRRFHADPRVIAAQPLLYERIPGTPPLYFVPTRERPPSRAIATQAAPLASRFDTPHTDSPTTQLLSNGRFTAMITGAGGGFCRWRDFEITRWRADPTRDNWGSFCYIRDVDRGQVWSSAYQPTRVEADEYAVALYLDRVEIRRRDHDIDTVTEINVSPEDDAEIRRYTLINRANRTRHVEVTSFAELSLAPHSADRQHPAFNKLFIQTEAIPDKNVLLAYRRLRDPDEAQIFVAHLLTQTTSPESPDDPFWYETDRARFIGRGRSTENPIGLSRPLSNTAGFVLDPIFCLRRTLVLQPGQRVGFASVLAAADTREGALALMDKYRQRHVIEQVAEVAWAHAQLQLRQLRIQPDSAHRFQQLASYMLFPNARLRPPAERLAQNRLGQSGLWPHGISGDLPIAVVAIGDASDIGVVREMLLAHTYWRHHGLKADLVILIEASGGYERPLREQLTALIHGFSMFTGVDQPGGVFLRDVDQMLPEDVTLILSVARVALVAARGPLAQQLGAPGATLDPPRALRGQRTTEAPSSALPHLELSHANGIGGFTADGREYVVDLRAGDQTPAPWSNVLANPEFGTLVTESGSGFTWFGNSQRNRLTPWSNDPVSDPSSEALYIRDEETGRFWTPTPLPIREPENYRTRHGAGYSVFEHNSHGIEQELTVFVPVDDAGGEPVRIQQLSLRNDSPKPRRLSVTFFAELVLGEDREVSMTHVVTHWDRDAAAMSARNRYNGDYADRVAFATLSPAPTAYTGDRSAFVGRNGTLAEPSAMVHADLSRRHGAGLDPCFALRVHVDLAPGQRKVVVCVLGEASSSDEAAQLIRKYRDRATVGEVLAQTKTWWDERLGTIEVDVPERSATILLNRWLLYQTLACRVWGRSGFFQSGGAYGFRDQLQDVMALLYAAPDLAREHILRSARRQFCEGDVQHWWHPPTGAGVRTRISDDLLWLPYVVAQYVRVTGDVEILNEGVQFIEARVLEEGEMETYLVPTESAERASLYEHCRRAIERGATAGPHGLPLIGAGDWNDGLNRVGIEGKGESVWLAWFLIDTMNGFAELSELLGQAGDAEAYRERATKLARVVASEAWDGEWYRRASFDDGTPIGSAASVEAKIDSLPQSWSWLSGAAELAQSTQALESAWEHLVLEKEKMVLLFTPPFDAWDKDPGYIKGYPPGVRENGGQYTHGAVWLAMALARSGDGRRAARLLQMLNPIEHALDAEAVARYVVEPYVVAADVYRLPGRTGRGGWTWYTGSAGWMYRAWIEEVLGFTLRGHTLRVDPVIPASWPGFSVRYRRGEAVYEIVVDNTAGVERGVVAVTLDGRTLEDQVIPLESERIKHRVVVRMGGGSKTS